MNKELQKRLISSLILIPLCFFFIFKGSIIFIFFLLFCFFTTSIEWYQMSKKKNYNLLGYFFLLFSFYCAYNLRTNFGDKSLSIFLLIIITCIFTDIGGYIFGNIFKGAKLTKISPKKTYSGMIGGFISAVIIASIYFIYSDVNLPEQIKSMQYYLILVLLISAISQVGDIIVSYFKRLSKIKDTGNLIPGHGGILDRIDGMIFAFPFSYIIFSLEFMK